MKGGRKFESAVSVVQQISGQAHDNGNYSFGRPWMEWSQNNDGPKARFLTQSGFKKARLNWYEGHFYVPCCRICEASDGGYLCDGCWAKTKNAMRRKYERNILVIYGRFRACQQEHKRKEKERQEWQRVAKPAINQVRGWLSARRQQAQSSLHAGSGLLLTSPT